MPQYRIHFETQVMAPVDRVRGRRAIDDTNRGVVRHDIGECDARHRRLVRRKYLTR